MSATTTYFCGLLRKAFKVRKWVKCDVLCSDLNLTYKTIESKLGKGLLVGPNITEITSTGSPVLPVQSYPLHHHPIRLLSNYPFRLSMVRQGNSQSLDTKPPRRERTIGTKSGHKKCLFDEWWTPSYGRQYLPNLVSRFGTEHGYPAHTDSFSPYGWIFPPWNSKRKCNDRDLQVSREYTIHFVCVASPSTQPNVTD